MGNDERAAKLAALTARLEAARRPIDEATASFAQAIHASSEATKGFRNRLAAIEAAPTQAEIIAVARVDLGISEEELQTMTVRKLDSFLKRAVRREARQARLSEPLSISEPSAATPHRQPKGFEGLSNRERVDQSRYTEQARLTQRQLECYALVKEYRLPLREAARRLNLHHTTVFEHVKVAERRIVLAMRRDGSARRGAVHPRD